MTNRPSSRELGVRAIVAYKSIKACVQLGLSALLALLLPFGLPGKVHAVALALRHHVTHAWAVRLAELLVSHATRRSLWLSIAALAFDGLLTALEGWSLAHGFVWAPWLIVFATSTLLPFELYEVFKRPRVVRCLVFVVNLLIVVYLGKRALREYAERRHESRVKSPSDTGSAS